jgi:hypothetical protein
MPIFGLIPMPRLLGHGTTKHENSKGLLVTSIPIFGLIEGLE